MGNGLRSIQAVRKKEEEMNNHFKTALSDPEVIERYRGKPFHMAILHALAAYKEKGHSLYELPWFALNEKKKTVKKAA
jgi:hypothetical protein